MRKAILGAATLAALATMPVGANAQNAVGGAIVGAGAGAVIGGTTGAAVGANADERRYRHRSRVCWEDDWGRRHCRYRY